MADLARLFDFAPNTLIKSSEVDAELNQIIARIGALEPDDLLSALAEKLGVSQTGAVRRGKSIVATEEARTNTAYGTLATPDRVAGVVVPDGALVLVSYAALWKESVELAARAALFIGSNQLKIPKQGGPVIEEAAISVGAYAEGLYSRLASSPIGLVGQLNSGIDTASDVTTGQALVTNLVGAYSYEGGAPLTDSHRGGLLVIDNLAAGTYDFTVQFKASSGSVTAKERRLKVVVLGF